MQFQKINMPNFTSIAGIIEVIIYSLLWNLPTFRVPMFIGAGCVEVYKLLALQIYAGNCNAFLSVIDHMMSHAHFRKMATSGYSAGYVLSRPASCKLHIPCLIVYFDAHSMQSASCRGCRGWSDWPFCSSAPL